MSTRQMHEPKVQLNESDIESDDEMMHTDTWVPRANRQHKGGEAERQAIALEVLCKMVNLLDGEFAQQIVSAGGVQCLGSAMVHGDAAQARAAQIALRQLCEKLPRSTMATMA